MSGKDPVPQEMSYQGVRATNPPNVIISKGTTARAPTANDKKYPLGTIWVNSGANTVYVLTSVAANAAVWTIIS